MHKIFLILFVVLFYFSTSQAADLIQENEKGEFSAHLDNIKLSEITKFIQKKYNIEFKGQDPQLQTPITMSFEKLNFEQMVKKVLTRINFVFTYNKEGKVTQVTLLQAGNTKAGEASNQNNVKNDVPQAGNVAPDQTANFPDTPNSAPDEITSFKIVPNTPPPGGAVGDSKDNGPDPITSFKIEPNSPPPGE